MLYDVSFEWIENRRLLVQRKLSEPREGIHGEVVREVISGFTRQELECMDALEFIAVLERRLE